MGHPVDGIKFGHQIVRYGRGFIALRAGHDRLALNDRVDSGIRRREHLVERRPHGVAQNQCAGEEGDPERDGGDQSDQATLMGEHARRARVQITRVHFERF